MKKAIILIALFAIILLSLIGYRLNQVTSVPTGGGPYIESPDKKYIAVAMLMTDEAFWGKSRKYYQFVIVERSSNKYINSLCMDTNNELGFPVKGDEDVISWSQDSKRATFTFADFSLNMDINNP